MRWLQERRRSERGAVIPMVALSLTVLMTMTAFAVDLGRMRTERRDLQANADAIALDAVQMIRGLSGPAAQLAARTEANRSAQRNGMAPTLTDAEVQVGLWDPATQGFTPTPTNTGVFPDAVLVDLDASVEMLFDFSADERTVSRRAVAVSRATTMGELGSVVAGVQPEVEDPTSGCAVGVAASVQMTVMNHVYTKLLGIGAGASVGGTVSQGVERNLGCQISGPADGLKLDAASYQGLAASRVTFRDLATAGSAGSPDDLLDQSVTQKRLLEITAQALRSGQDPSTVRYQAGSQLLAIAGRLSSSSTFVIGDVLRGSTGTSTAVADASVSALDLLFATATAINGKNFVGADGDLNVPLPLGTGGALVNVPTKVHVIERPQLDQVPRYAGQTGPSTSQVSIALNIPISVSNLGIDLSTLGIPGIGTPNTANATGSLPLVIEVGQASSTYPSIQCPSDGGPPVVRMSVASGAARVRIGTTTDTDFSDGVDVTTPGQLATGTSRVTTLGVNVLGVGISLQADVDMAARTTIPYVVGQSFTAAGAVPLATGTGLTAGGGTASNEFTFIDPGPTGYYRYRGGFNNVSVADSVVSSFDFGASSSGLLGLLSSEAQSKAARNGVVQKALDPLLGRLDTTVLQPLFNALGATLGGADARIHEVQCQVPALANRD